MDAYTTSTSAIDYSSNVDHSHIKLYVTLGLSFGTIVLLFYILGNILMYKPMGKTTQSQPRGIVPILMKNQQDLNNALKTYDNPNIDNTVQTGLNKNAQDATRFSQ